MVLWMMESPKRKNIRLEVLSKAMLIAGHYGCIRIVRIVFGDLSEAQRKDVAGQSLGQAIREGNRDLVDLFAAYHFGSDDLCLAVERSGLEIVRTMLSRDSSPALLNGMNANMSTPLTLAAQYLKEDIAVFLLGFPGIDPSRHDRSHMTPLLYAASGGNYVITKAILDCYGSAVSGRIPEVNRAIRKAMRFSISTGQTADQQVRLQSKMDILLALLSVPGVDVNPIAKSETLLQCAARSGSAELVRELLKFPETDVNDFSDGGTALILALEGGFDDVSLMLIECDRVDLNYRHQKKGTAVQVAAQKGHAPVLKALITSPRFDPNRHELSHFLELAICQNRIEICQSLLEATLVDVDLSLLVGPILGAGDRMIECFLTHPTFLNCPDELALSILKQACRQDRVRAVELLLQRFDENVNLVIADSLSQDSLLGIAVECGSDRVIDFIVSHPKFDVVSSRPTQCRFSGIRSGPAQPSNVQSNCQASTSMHVPQMAQLR
jgi:ankyrin repeat protein